MDADRKPAGLDSPWVGRLLKHVGRAHVWAYRRTGGRVGGRFRLGAGWRKPVPVLLLDHVGRRSRTPYTTPLLWLEDGPDAVVVASQGGRAHHPQWYRNLMATPDTTVQIGAEVRPVRARTAAPAERERLWPRLVDLYADFGTYQAWTEREIPVVICSPR
jgi:F420H(2)-dependent quinone reductase